MPSVLGLTGLKRSAAFAAGICFGGFVALAAPAQAQRPSTEPVSGIVTCGDSAYQLVRATTNRGKSGVRWAEAENAARRFTHDGRRARLAVIPNLEVHACVSDNLLPNSQNETWIGLRYWCQYRSLQWTTGDLRPHSKPSPWAVQWSRYGTCQTQFAGVYYTPGSKRWQVVESKKRFRYMIVEYPPAGEASQEQAEK